jgi:hypothetical protein
MGPNDIPGFSRAQREYDDQEPDDRDFDAEQNLRDQKGDQQYELENDK